MSPIFLTAISGLLLLGSVRVLSVSAQSPESKTAAAVGNSAASFGGPASVGGTLEGDRRSGAGAQPLRKCFDLKKKIGEK